MNLMTLFIIAVGLSMDAFAVSICKGLALKKVTIKHSVIVGLWFGGFQGGMPLIGYLLGIRFEKHITSIDHWIAFVLLLFIGASMLKESRSTGNEESSNDSLAPKTMFLLAIATSIDALAVGVTFAFLQVSILPAISFIAVITFVFSCVGIKIGNIFGIKYKSRAEMAGGFILIIMGFKILIEHLAA